MENQKRATRKFPCTICPKVLTRNDNLQVHMRIHTGERPFTCEICGIKFIDIRPLRDHKRIKHGIKEPPKELLNRTCEVCGMTLKQVGFPT